MGSQVPASQAPTSQPDPAPAAVAENPAPQVEAQKPLTAEELRTLLNGYISRHSMEDAIEKLKGYGCNRVSEALTLEPAKLAELAAVLRG